jgi:hypothetical protein
VGAETAGAADDGNTAECGETMQAPGMTDGLGVGA